MKTAIIVQARMTSTRLPGKVMKEVLGKPLLEYQIERLLRVKLSNELVIATTINEADQPIVELCEKLDVLYYRGSENDVLSRYYNAAKEHRSDIVVRVTSDCPIIDPEVIDNVIQYYFDHQNQYDFVSNSLNGSYPRGMDVEVFTFKVLSEAVIEAVKQSEREHVTPFIYNQPQRYKLANIPYFEDQSSHRWTVDTVEDFDLIKKIIETLYPKNPNFGIEEVLGIMKEHPEYMNINKNIKQKMIS